MFWQLYDDKFIGGLLDAITGVWSNLGEKQSYSFTAIQQRKYFTVYLYEEF